MTRSPLIRLLSVTTLAFASACVRRSATPPAGAPRTAPLFEFHSNFWVNLHQFLYITARARKGLDANRPTTRDALGDTAGFAALPASARAAFDSALAFYTRAIADRDMLFDSALVDQNWRLSHVSDPTSLRGAGVDPSLAAELERAAPAYRAVWWPRHDSANARWRAKVQPLLEQHADSAARWESARFFTPWPVEMRTDLAGYAGWAGAYTVTEPAHITLASTNGANMDLYAFETLFHESLHTLDAALADSLIGTFRAAGKREPRDPTHPIIFYTAGEITRRLLSSNHVPYAERRGLWTNPDYARMRPLIIRYWQPYLDGTLSLHDALRGIAAGW